MGGRRASASLGLLVHDSRRYECHRLAQNRPSKSCLQVQAKCCRLRWTPEGQGPPPVLGHCVPGVSQALGPWQEDLEFCHFSGTCSDLSPFPAYPGFLRSNSRLLAGGGWQPRLLWARQTWRWAQWGVWGVCSWAEEICLKALEEQSQLPGDSAGMSPGPHPRWCVDARRPGGAQPGPRGC